MSHELDEYIYGSRGRQPAAVARLESWIEHGRYLFRKLWDAGEHEEALAVRERSAPLLDELHRLQALLCWRGAVPVPWTHDRTEAEIEEKISAPTLRKVAAECFDGKRNVLLLGPTGCGKTTTHCLMARRHYLAHREYNQSMGKFMFPLVRWVYSRDLAASVAQHALGKGEPERVTKARDAALLILDDIGQERDHGALLDVLQHRNQFNKPTWTSSGLTLEQLRERYGEAFVRRLVEMGGQPGKVISCFARAKLAAVGGAK